LTAAEYVFSSNSTLLLDLDHLADDPARPAIFSYRAEYRISSEAARLDTVLCIYCTVNPLGSALPKGAGPEETRNL
jgi:hypothetical protein